MGKRSCFMESRSRKVTVSFRSSGRTARTLSWSRVLVALMAGQMAGQMADQMAGRTGAQTDRRLGIEGEDLEGSHPATEFVA